MLNGDLISVVVPVYQCSNTIDDCLQSILSQTYSNIEILIIDDGSTDSTAKKVLSYTKNDKRIKLFTQTRQGVSVARNRGIEHAKGNYIVFIDGDDFVQKDYIYKMWSIIKKSQTDLVICGYNRLIYDVTIPQKPLLRNSNLTSKEFIKMTLIDPGHHYFGVVWNKMFCLDVIKKNRVYFHSDITLGEDFVFLLEYLLFINNVRIIHNKLYFYRYQNRNSLSRIYCKNRKDCQLELENREKIFAQYIKDFKKFDLQNEYNKEMHKYWIMFYIRQIYSIKHEYKWSLEDKNNWKKELEENSLIKYSKSLFSDSEISKLYFEHLIHSSFRKIEKNTFYMTVKSLKH
ncbi:glycosyltransferase family 2 protein [Butyrivibrio sp. NC3005]|uniref:glycosyltransferase family 2 protein n=1 Tax=Butyrivibrio sp. NC3005 TaxID=1280685 RepID=UPI00041758C7|nr:glycosyltransferase family 2 protein [Butyrivibrio sp. NC3005]